MALHPALPWTLRSIARLERAGGIRPPRLTETGHEKWHRIRRRLGWRECVRLLHEDLAETWPYPFDVRRWSADPFAELTDDEAEALITEAARPDDADPSAFLRAAARDLGLPAGGALSELPRVAPGQRVLELPGSAGRVAAWVVANQPGLAFHAQFVFVADGDAERALVGLAAVEARANEPTVLTRAQALAALRDGQQFDRVLGVRCPQAEALVAEAGLGEAKLA